MNKAPSNNAKTILQLSCIGITASFCGGIQVDACLIAVALVGGPFRTLIICLDEHDVLEWRPPHMTEP